MMAVERSAIRWGTTQIPYLIRRSDRRGTVAVAVEPSGQVVLTAPATATVERLDRVVRQKARWIVERARSGGRLPRPAEREFVSGETALYLGRNYRLRVVEAVRAAPTRLERGWLVVTIERDLFRAERARHVRDHLVEWYRRHATVQLPARAARWAAKLRARPTEILIRDPRARWGSCGPSGALRFSWRIIQAAPTLIDYVVAHELVHLLHPRHTPAFWAALGRTIPDYDTRRRRLREFGPALVW
jgi:predicted metal-dependent hydrolase